MTLTPHFKLTPDQAFKKLVDVYEPVRGKQRRDLESLIRLLERAETEQTFTKTRLLNPKAAGQDLDWCKVQQLAEDLSYQSLPQDLRDQIHALESQLTQDGIIY